jgi:hypothetical protein
MVSAVEKKRLIKYKNELKRFKQIQACKLHDCTKKSELCARLNRSRAHVEMELRCRADPKRCLDKHASAH